MYYNSAQLEKDLTHILSFYGVSSPIGYFQRSVVNINGLTYSSDALSKDIKFAGVPIKRPLLMSNPAALTILELAINIDELAINETTR